MKVHTFEAASLREAIQKVKGALGRDALILTTRTYVKGGVLGIGGRSVVEVTAIPGRAVKKKSRRRRKKPAAPNGDSIPATVLDRIEKKKPAPLKANVAKLLNEAYALLESEDKGAFAEDKPVKERPAKSPVRAEPADTYVPSMPQPMAREFSAIHSLEKQMSEMKGLLESMTPEAKEKKIVPVPMEYEELYRYLLDQSIAEKVAKGLVTDISERCRARGLELAELLLRITDKLEEKINVGGPITPPAHGPKTVAFIGPTGVGKTTSIAKIAAILKLRQSVPVGLITIDTYRIAAVQQLQTYADIMKIPCKSVLTPLELRRAIAEMRRCPVILIDTAGRSQRDDLKMDELATFLNVGAPTETHLVVSSNSHPKAMREVVERFGRFRVDRLLFTKTDEAVCLGPLLEIILSVRKPISYITTGQEVPEDIEVVEGRRFARMLLGEVA